LTFYVNFSSKLEMARIRTVKHEFFLDEKVAELDTRTRLAFIGLWTLADRAGRLVDSPKRIRAELFPYEPRVDMEAALAELATAGLIVRYQVGAQRFVQVTNFTRHQRPNLREPDSEIPAIADGTCVHVQTRAEQNTSDRSAARNGVGEGNGEGNGVGEGEGIRAEPPVLTFVVAGGGPEWGLTGDMLRDFQAAFPGLDVRSELVKAQTRVKHDAGMRKTFKGMPRFLQNWLEQAQNWGRGKSPPPAGSPRAQGGLPLGQACEFHRRPGSQGKKAMKHEWRADCAECKHVDARANPRPPSEPASIADLVTKLGGR